MSEQSRLVVTDQDGVSIIRFSEPTLLNAFHVTEVGEELVNLIEKGGLSKIVLDLASIKMLSSQALSVLLTLRQKLTDSEGKMVISGVDPRLYRVFKVTNLQSVFEFYNDADSAVKSFV